MVNAVMPPTATATAATATATTATATANSRARASANIIVQARVVLQLMRLPYDLLEQIAHALCPVDDMLLWIAACRLAQTCTIFRDVVRAMRIFCGGDSGCGDVAFDDTTSANKFDFVSVWRRTLPPAITRGFSSALSSYSTSYLQALGVRMEAALVVHRDSGSFKPVWRFVVARYDVNEDDDNNNFFVHVTTLRTYDVLSLLRCPPGFQEALVSERERLDHMSAVNRLHRHNQCGPEIFTKEQFATAHADRRPQPAYWFFSYRHQAQPIAVESTRRYQLWHSQPILLVGDCAVYYPTDLRATCASEKVPQSRPACYFYSQHLEVEYGGDLLDWPNSVDFIFDRAAREAMGFSTEHTVNRYEFVPRAQRPYWLAETENVPPWIKPLPQRSEQAPAEPGAKSAAIGPKMPLRQMQRDLGALRWRAQLADEARGSDAEVDADTDLLPAHRPRAAAATNSAAVATTNTAAVAATGGVAGPSNSGSDGCSSGAGTSSAPIVIEDSDEEGTPPRFSSQALYDNDSD